MTSPCPSRLRSIPQHKDKAWASCIQQQNTGGFPTSNYMYQNWNTCFLRKLQRELYQAQQILSPTLTARIRSMKTPLKRHLKPVVFTTVRNRTSHRLNRGKLQASLSYLSTEQGNPVGEQPAREVIQRVSLLCKQRKEKSNRTSISGGKLTRWCAGALLAQEVHVSQELLAPPTDYRLGCRRFISGDRDIAAAHTGLDSFLNSRCALSLLRREHITNNTLPDTLPENSDESPDSVADT